MDAIRTMGAILAIALLIGAATMACGEESSFARASTRGAGASWGTPVEGSSWYLLDSSAVESTFRYVIAGTSTNFRSFTEYSVPDFKFQNLGGEPGAKDWGEKTLPVNHPPEPPWGPLNRPDAYGEFDGSSEVDVGWFDLSTADWSARAKVIGEQFVAGQEAVTTAKATVADPWIVQLNAPSGENEYVFSTLDLAGSTFNRAGSEYLLCGAPLGWSIVLETSGEQVSVSGGAVTLPLSGDTPFVCVDQFVEGVSYFFNGWGDAGFAISSAVSSEHIMRNLIASSFSYDPVQDSWEAGPLEIGFVAPLPTGAYEFSLFIETSASAADLSMGSTSTEQCTWGRLKGMFRD